MSDDELLRATAAAGEAFGVFYDRHVQAVLGFFARSTGDRELALDLAAETFAAALGAAGKFRPRVGGPPPRAWLFGIAKNILRRSRKRTGIEQRARRKLGIPRLEFTEEGLDSMDFSGAESVYLSSLATLNAEERDAVTARVLDERDYADIAKASGTSEATIRKRVSRGLKRLSENHRGER